MKPPKLQKRAHGFQQFNLVVFGVIVAPFRLSDAGGYCRQAGKNSLWYPEYLPKRRQHNLLLVGGSDNFFCRKRWDQIFCYKRYIAPCFSRKGRLIQKWPPVTLILMIIHNNEWDMQMFCLHVFKERFQHFLTSCIDGILKKGVLKTIHIWLVFLKKL